MKNKPEKNSKLEAIREINESPDHLKNLEDKKSPEETHTIQK
jgi:hypothetical protein